MAEQINSQSLSLMWSGLTVTADTQALEMRPTSSPLPPTPL